MDIRLYYYKSGQLMKFGTTKGTYRFDNIESAKQFIEFKKKPTKYHKGIVNQWVIIEYFSNYNSKIIEIYE